MIAKEEFNLQSLQDSTNPVLAQAKRILETQPFNYEPFKKFVENQTNIASLRTPEQGTLLHLVTKTAIKNSGTHIEKFVSMVNLLKTYKINIDSKDQAGRDVCMFALDVNGEDTRKIEITLKLLELGAKPQADNQHNTLLHYVAACSFEPGKSLNKSSAEFIVKNQLDAINTQNNKGDTPLHIAIRHKQMSLFEVLVDNKVDWTIINKDKKSSLEILDQQQKQTMLLYLIDKNPDQKKSFLTNS